MTRKLIALLKAKDLENPVVRKNLKAVIKHLKAEAKYEEDRKYYGMPKVTQEGKIKLVIPPPSTLSKEDQDAIKHFCPDISRPYNAKYDEAHFKTKAKREFYEKLRKKGVFASTAFDKTVSEFEKRYKGQKSEEKK